MTITRLIEKEVTATDGISLKTFAIPQIMPAESETKDEDLKHPLHGLQRDTRNCATGVCLTETF